MKNIKLVVVYNGRTISIPFKNIALIDEFTTYYDNLPDIGIALNEILNLNLKDPTVEKIYISKTNEKKDLEEEYTEYLPVKYSFDLFDSGSVMRNYIDYLLKNEQLLYQKGSPLNKIMNNYMQKYSKIYLSDIDIERIAMLYLQNSSDRYNYDRIRKAYFTLIENGYKIKTIPIEKGSFPDRTDLTKYNPKNEFFEYLIRYSKIGEEEKAHAMDILASRDIEDMERDMYNEDYGLFDTKDIKTKRNFHDEALLLQSLTNMTIQELIDVINNYQQLTTERNKTKEKTK